ncbi:MAG: SLC13 family permease [Mobilicoccus sp.]|nr:SLC13 family permease [Mobilicoccus sp.]
MSDASTKDQDQSDVPEEADTTAMSARKWAVRALGVGLSVLAYWLLGMAEVSEDARAVGAIAVLMAVWWMTEALPLPITSLTPIVLIPALTDIPIGEATAPFAQPIVYLFLGGFVIAIAMQKWNLHRRVALYTLKAVGTAPRRIVLGMMIATAGLSMWVNNVATTLMMLPIAISILALVAERVMTQREGATEESIAKDMERVESGTPISEVVDDKNVRRFGVALFLAVGWSASIGGLGTLFGSVPNAFIAAYLADHFDVTLRFFDWLLLGLPVVVIFIATSWLLITYVLFRFDLAEIPGGDEMIQSEIDELGPLSQGEKTTMVVFASAAFLWVVPSLLANIGAVEAAIPWIGDLEDAAIAITAAISLFLLPAGNGRAVLEWKDAEKGLPWGVLLLFGGGLALAAAIADTGLDQWFGSNLEVLGTLNVILLVGGITLIINMLTEVTSNTATTAAFIPILAGVAMTIQVDPMLLMVPAALAASCAFMLPVGTPPNAIVFSTGAVKIQEMVKGGLALNVVAVVLITVATVTLGQWALGIEMP